jgi:hypothetical protein
MTPTEMASPEMRVAAPVSTSAAAVTATATTMAAAFRDGVSGRRQRGYQNDSSNR